ncbi:hypothetical protein Fmac_007975 [Flemingia macrophylla]|uniref:Myosin motor domain-containing protein n=1 Tax=Flemingia macrophylla TaxID=520843 RepID=A0ABD1MW31_9FABA
MYPFNTNTRSIKALDCNVAVAGWDASAKTIYACLFDLLVDTINSSVRQDTNSQMQIGVLDIYGFKCGALCLTKNKLEKQLEELTWRLHLEKKIRVSNEKAKHVEISKLDKALHVVNLKLDATTLEAINENNKNAILQNQLQLWLEEKIALEREVVTMDEVRKENALLKGLLDAFEKKNAYLELELVNARKDHDETIKKMREFELKCSQLRENVKSLEENPSSLEDENHVLR